MEVTVTRKGADLTALINQQLREISNANRKTGREAAKVGVKAFKAAAGVSRFAGYPLKFKAKKVTATDGGAHIHFQASPVGFWVILESGAGPHEIRPRAAGAKARPRQFRGKRIGGNQERKGEALRAGSDTFWAHVNHPGMSGTGAYSRGEAAAIKAMDKVVDDVYGEAMGV